MINTEDYDNPITHLLKNDFELLDSKLEKFIDFYFKFNDIYTDHGLIFENSSKKSVYGFDKIDFRYSTIDDTTGLIYQVYFNSSFNRSKITRNYQKFQELSADIGGFMEIYIFFSSLICTYFNEMFMNVQMINSFFTKCSDNVNKKLNEIKEKQSLGHILDNNLQRLVTFE